MTQWIKFERLPGNDLDLPEYQTEMSVAFDLAACLTRPCKTPTSKFGQKCEFSKFLAQAGGTRYVVDGDSLGGNGAELHIRPGETVLVSTGFRLEFPKTHALFVHVRSSTGVHGLTMANGTAVIDADFRGELFMPLYNRTQEDIIIKHGYRVCQAELPQASRANIMEAEVSKTERGEGGFGSTG